MPSSHATPSQRQPRPNLNLDHAPEAEMERFLERELPDDWDVSRVAYEPKGVVATTKFPLRIRVVKSGTLPNNAALDDLLGTGCPDRDPDYDALRNTVSIECSPVIDGPDTHPTRPTASHHRITAYLPDHEVEIVLDESNPDETNHWHEDDLLCELIEAVYRYEDTGSPPPSND